MADRGSKVRDTLLRVEASAIGAVLAAALIVRLWQWLDV